jgi:F-type H+/Na+-transporting ATPase subunit alpha
MKQKQYSPLSVAEMAVSLFAADKGYIDDVELNKVVPFERELHAYMRANHADLLQQINQTRDYNDEIATALSSAITAFKSTQTW